MADYASFNMNDRAKVRLTPAGVEHYRKEMAGLNASIRSCGGKGDLKTEPNIDGDGFYHAQLWSLMQEFGAGIGMARPILFEDNRVWIEITAADPAQPRGDGG